MLKQTEQMKEIRIPSIVMATEENELLLIGETKIQACFWKTRDDFLDAKLQNMLQNNDDDDDDDLI